MAWRNGAPGPVHRLRGKQKPRAGGRASRRRAERSLTGGAAAPPLTRGLRLPHAPSTPPRGKPREGWRRRDRQRRADSRVHRARARSIPAAMAPVPVAAAAASRAPRLSAARAAAQPLSPPSRPPARPLARSPARPHAPVAQPRAGHRRRRLAAPASRLVRRAAPAVVPPPPAAGPASHRLAKLSIRPQKARGL